MMEHLIEAVGGDPDDKVKIAYRGRNERISIQTYEGRLDTLHFFTDDQVDELITVLLYARKLRDERST